MEQVRPRSSNPDPRRRSSPSSSAASVRSARSRSSRRASKRRSSRSWGDRLKSRIREALYIGLFDALPLLRDPMLLVVISLFSFLPVIFIFVFADQKSAMQSLVGVLVALVLLLLSGPAPAFGILVALATSLLLWIGLVFVGFAIGATTKNARRANSIPQVLSIALGFLPPVYYPLSKLDAYPAAQAFAMLIPTTHAAQLAKYYFGLVDIPGWQVALGWAYLLGFAALMGFLASRRAHWVDP